MKKLFKLKTWLTVAEAANHLTTIFEEPVSESDVLRLALDHRLKLSVIFIDSVLASNFKPIDESKDFNSLPGGGDIIYAPDGRMLQSQAEVFYLENDWAYDLSMLGNERSHVNRKYWRLVGESGPDLDDQVGVFVCDGENHFQIKVPAPESTNEKSTAIPATQLPADIALVVRCSALLDLEKSFRDDPVPDEKPLAAREKNTLLKIIIGMAIKGYGYDPNASKSEIPKRIETALGLLGMDVTDETISKYLKLATAMVLPKDLN